MALFTSRLNLYKPGGGLSGTNLPDEVADIDKINSNMDLVDGAVGIKRVTSTTRPATPFDGQTIYETDTRKTLIYTGSAWFVIIPDTTDLVAAVSNALPGPTGLVLLKPTSVAGTGVSLGANGKVSFTASTSISLNGIFSAAYDNYLLILTMTTASGANPIFGRYRAAGVDFATASQRTTVKTVAAGGTTETIASTTTAPYAQLGQVSGVGGSSIQVDIWNPYPAVEKSLWARGHCSAGMIDAGAWAPSAVGITDGFTLLTNTAVTITGSVRVYGYNNG